MMERRNLVPVLPTLWEEIFMSMSMIFMSVNNASTAVNLIQKTEDMCARACLRLHKFGSNKKELSYSGCRSRRPRKGTTRPRPD